MPLGIDRWGVLVIVVVFRCRCRCNTIPYHNKCRHARTSMPSMKPGNAPMQGDHLLQSNPYLPMYLGMKSIHPRHHIIPAYTPHHTTLANPIPSPSTPLPSTPTRKETLTSHLPPPKPPPIPHPRPPRAHPQINRHKPRRTQRRSIPPFPGSTSTSTSASHPRQTRIHQHLAQIMRAQHGAKQRMRAGREGVFREEGEVDVGVVLEGGGGEEEGEGEEGS